MKVLMSTSNAYLHLLPISCYLFNKNWSPDQVVEIVGYKEPEFELPPNFFFTSMGEQGPPEEFSTDLRKVFERCGKYTIWLFDDTFIKSVDFYKLEIAKKVIEMQNVGRVGLSNDSFEQYTYPAYEIDGIKINSTPQGSEYRLSTQISIWNKDYLFKYLTPGLHPWSFEYQEKKHDEFHNLCLGEHDSPISHNEGVRKWDLYKYKLDGIPEYQINEMKELGIL